MNEQIFSMRKLWDSLSELRSSICDRRLERTVLRPALLPVKTAQFSQFFPRQAWRHTVKSLSLTEGVQGSLQCPSGSHELPRVASSKHWLDSSVSYTAFRVRFGRACACSEKL